MPAPLKILPFLLFSLLVIAGCASLPDRNPLPVELRNETEISGIVHARAWADELLAPDIYELTPQEARQRFSGIFGQQLSYLAISGGGPRGAFGAGLLNGWTASGKRPEFAVVTGVSTGSLIAPFAFLGPKYDYVLKDMYTKYSTGDLIERRSLLATIQNDAAADTAPLRKLIATYVDEDLIAAIAAEYKKGRSLDIITTNLDAVRPVRWDIGRIAASEAPNALQLIRDVMLASASVPGVFPPVMFEVEANGKVFDEMHVDGAVTALVYLYPVKQNAKKFTDLVEAKGKPTAYIIRNGYLIETLENVERRTLPIAIRTITSFFGTIGTGDLYRIYLETMRDDIDFRLASIPETFDAESNEPFDVEYMGELFQLGFDLAKNGYDWETAAPGYDEGRN